MSNWIEKLQDFVAVSKKFNESNNISGEVEFVTGDIKCYVDINHTKTVLLENKVSLLKTKHYGFVPLALFPEEIKEESDIQKTTYLCNKITQLETEGMAAYYGALVVTGSMLAHAFKPRDIILGDSMHAGNSMYAPFVDEETIKPLKQGPNQKVKTIIEQEYKNKK